MDFKVNVNEQVKVKLTGLGLSIITNRRRELNQMIESRGGKGLGEFQLKTDDEGYTTFQLWDLMQTFGSVLTMGFEIPFETDIIIKNGKQL
jgi:hypothetical protein